MDIMYIFVKETNQIRIWNTHLRTYKRSAKTRCLSFGSNLAGIHAGGAARVAHMRFGAVMGQGVGSTGAILCHTDDAGGRGDHQALCR